jgi:hypothetical protein
VGAGEALEESVALSLALAHCVALEQREGWLLSEPEGLAAGEREPLGEGLPAGEREGVGETLGEKLVVPVEDSAPERDPEREGESEPLGEAVKEGEREAECVPEGEVLPEMESVSDSVLVPTTVHVREPVKGLETLGVVG